MFKRSDIRRCEQRQLLEESCLDLQLRVCDRSTDKGAFHAVGQHGIQQLASGASPKREVHRGVGSGEARQDWGEAQCCRGLQRADNERSLRRAIVQSCAPCIV